MVDRSSPETEAVDRVAKAIDEAVAKWQPGSGQRIHEMVARAAIEAFGAAQTPAVPDWERRANDSIKHHAFVELYKLCRTLGNFKNGVEHNGIDEGEVYASGIFDRVEAALRLPYADTSTDRLRAENKNAALNEAMAEVERLRAGLQKIVDFKDPLPRAVVREACAELLAPSDSSPAGNSK